LRLNEVCADTRASGMEVGHLANFSEAAFLDAARIRHIPPQDLSAFLARTFDGQKPPY